MSGWQGGKRCSAGVEGVDINHKIWGLLTRPPEDSRVPVLLSYHQLCPHTQEHTQLHVHMCVCRHTHTVTEGHSSPQRLILKTDYSNPKWLLTTYSKTIKNASFQKQVKNTCKNKLGSRNTMGSTLFK